VEILRVLDTHTPKPLDLGARILDPSHGLIGAFGLLGGPHPHVRDRPADTADPTEDQRGHSNHDAHPGELAGHVTVSRN
jgi:hypothetical protein